jgi:superfamily II DNA helicase RecQ
MIPRTGLAGTRERIDRTAEPDSGIPYYDGRMVNFFKQAPARDTHQKRFLEAIANQRDVIASFPLAYPAVSLYAFTAMMGGGVVVVVCPGSRQIRRNVEYFKAAGFGFPDVAVLDGTQMPHEERGIRDEINRHRVRVLLTTPERFTSLTFLEIIVRLDLAFLVIEEADRFLPSSLGHNVYRRFQEEGLGQLRRLPPLLLMVPPLSHGRIRELAAKLHLEDFQLVQEEPVFASVDVRVKTLFTEHQKFALLADSLSGSPGPGKLGRLDGTGSVLIQTAYPAQAEKLGASLLDYGFESVWITHFKKSPQEQAQAQEIANTRLNTIIVNAGTDMRAWMPPRESSPRVVFWTPPAGVDDLFVQIFRQLTTSQAGYDPSHGMKAMLLHTKEDYHMAMQRLRASQSLDFTEMHDRLLALKHYRRWLFSEGCRLQTLVAYYEGSTQIEVPPCERCDRCQEARYARSRFTPVRRLVQRWLF